jgi:hypothetical protein
MQPITITWQRLVDEDGQTCARCGGTEQELVKAVRFLTKALAPVGIVFSLEQVELSQEEFAKDPLQSNRILVDGRDLAVWLEGQVGQSPCCGPCGDSQCRTLTVGGQVHETIPAEVIIQAGLKAAYQKATKPCSQGPQAKG